MMNKSTIFLLLNFLFLGLYNVIAQTKDSATIKLLNDCAQSKETLIWKKSSSTPSQKDISIYLGYNINNQLTVVASIQGTNVECSNIGEHNDEHYCPVEAEKKEPSRKRRDLNNLENRTLQNISSDETLLFKDNVLRTYRLALAIAPTIFKSQIFDSSNDKVYAFWSRVEAYLNELYLRDVGVKFEVIADDRLINISQYPNDNVYNASTLISSSTSVINQLIGTENYDIGLVVANINYNGLARLGGAYINYEKARATARPLLASIAHEIGHLFGADHTFTESNSNSGSIQTEPLRGTSIMSYGNPRDFFSLPSVYQIKKRLTKTPYYTDRERTTVVGETTLLSNIPYGEVLNNTAPVILNNFKSTYTIPLNTCFEFDIEASDQDGDRLFYLAHQSDFNPSRLRPRRQALFVSRKMSPNSVVEFKDEYVDGFYLFGLPSSSSGAIADFWVAVADQKANSNTPHITMYDVKNITVMANPSYKPFRITSTLQPSYNGGETIPLTWEMDESMRAQYDKVSISISNDFGKTYTLLADDVPNTGQYQLTLPNRSIGTVSVRDREVPAGIIKIKPKNSIIFALTNYQPYTSNEPDATVLGGFTLTPTAAISTPKSKCHKPANTSKEALPTKVVISTLSNNDQITNSSKGGFIKLVSHNKPFVITRLTTDERNQIADPKEGMLIWNTTKQCLELYKDFGSGTMQWDCITEGCNE
ncbi:reprolysin-like metallopeptidase [Riemerella anatipestifer]|uniref:reprolysin-like metallopeptidase n=1 Tax=Riemerella anatipestifer TaxID=34085 RepID=UPI0009A1B81B|nr:M12 family metallo-peptidase [Riemerella anatipestifer]MCO4303458.1 M12 family metallo-peptidase [Riemerella anatipestifer]MCO7352417.1 M12 family metallo-peptidase [Riemerella anatipestifer]MCQ4038710.1 M12 family metallo-peptidase [Riemerella anatipestifer]MCT6760408.1 M12 family metallo-peptidase [Riemerella anatipestifer]MCT6764438.1 M12 family metallo-peptidase [Riemerella anatipestifer]